MRLLALYVLTARNCIDKLLDSKQREIVTELAMAATRGQGNRPIAFAQHLKQPPHLGKRHRPRQEIGAITLTLLFFQALSEPRSFRGAEQVSDHVIRVAA